MRRPSLLRSVLLAVGVLVAAARASGWQDGSTTPLPNLGLEVGEAHPDFALPDLDGGLARLSDLRGKRLLLFHFASW